ncbi:MAG: site-specific DNA-methyltransferase, partial [Proteobacteria bacterium]|nr:site-specific DNA-methyltransferase [Pseudomonadota bacterium]
MAKIKLTPEEKARVIDALNKGVEPSPDLLPKLFPGTTEKFDVQALDRAKIPTLEYSGKRSKATILAEAGAGIGAAPLQNVRCFGDIKNGGWRNLIVQGDNLQFLKTCYRNIDPLIKNKVKGKAKLIYIDPPFATKSEFGGKEAQRSYADKVDAAEFVESLRERLIYLRELLTDDGSIYVHLDQKMSHYLKIVLDEVFGKDRFLNEFIWLYSGREMNEKQWNPKHDILLCYSKTSIWTFNWEEVAEEPSPAAMAQYKNIDEKGRKFVIRSGQSKGLSKEGPDTYRQYYKPIPPRDYKYFSYISSSAEVTGYPTQKPESLIAHIILASTNSADLIMDCFAGSGTTPSVAEKLGRRWIACDFGKHAIYTMQRRMLRIGESKALVDEQDKSGKAIVKKGDPYKKAPKPFCIISSGAYDFSHVMDLRKHKETYIDFVLGLFQLSRDDDKVRKYKLANIYALKDGDPVEVYPVWDDQFLKEVKIDEEYLRGIIAQSGGRLKGDYFIITPESCANVGDTVIKNQDGKDVNFQMLTFPYKVLEDISRALELQEQP